MRKTNDGLDAQIFSLLQQGKKYKEIQDSLHVSAQRISRIVKSTSIPTSSPVKREVEVEAPVELSDDDLDFIDKRIVVQDKDTSMDFIEAEVSRLRMKIIRAASRNKRLVLSAYEVRLAQEVMFS